MAGSAISCRLNTDTKPIYNNYTPEPPLSIGGIIVDVDYSALYNNSITYF